MEKKKSKLPWLIAGAIVIVIAAVYIGVAVYFQNRFLPGTTVNGVKAAGRNWSEVEEDLLSVIDNYVLKIAGRNEVEDSITSQDVDLKMDFEGKVEEAQLEQNHWEWPLYLFKKTEIVMESAVSYDDALLESKIASLNCMNEEKALKPVDACISEYKSGEGFSIIPEVENNWLKKDVFQQMVETALAALNTDITLEMLEEADAYEHPEIYQDDKNLNSVLEQMNKMASVTITYKFGSNTETVDGETIGTWLVTDEQYQVNVDEERAREYINSLARKYDTYDGNGSRDFKTSYGTTVTIKGGDYGWWMNRADTTTEMIAAIKAGESKELEPVYRQKAASYSEQDYGNTYVEINLTAQHLFLYKDGKLILETDFVSGRPSIKNTPTGVYAVTYKEIAHTMTGEDYRVETYYWMPFAGHVGMHDATWRTRFGGTEYKTNGSHGCVNLPFYAARTIYNTIDKGSPVICYQLSGTERSAKSTQSNREIAEIGIAAIDRIGTVSSSNYSSAKKKVVWARQVYTDLNSSQRALVSNYQTLLDAEAKLKSLQ